MTGVFRNLAIAGVVLASIVLAMVAKAALDPALQAPRVGQQLNPRFSLLDQNAEPFTNANLQGKPRLIAFGYTSCPDVCPTVLSALAADIASIGQASDKANYIFVTVDPEHDTPLRLKRYLAAFSSHFTGLTGDPVAVSKMLRAYHVFQSRRTEADGHYVIDHTSIVFLIDGTGRLQDTINVGELGTPRADAKIKRLFDD
jgi:protein SCO1/2